MNKTAAVTGGAQGIGRAVSLAFAGAGYSVAIGDPHKQAGEETAALIAAAGGQAFYTAVDVGDEQAARQWLDDTALRWGRIDVLINNAGIGSNGSVFTLPLAEFDRVLGVNVRGTFVCSQQAAGYMRNQGGGAIVNIASTRALMSEPNTEAYSASKGAIVALTHAMAVSLGPYGIRVNAISPGWIETGPWQHADRHREPVHTERDRLQHPVGRVGKPEDIARACLYLADSEAGFITGQNLVIDGGMTIKMIYE